MSRNLEFGLGVGFDFLESEENYFKASFVNLQIGFPITILSIFADIFLGWSKLMTFYLLFFCDKILMIMLHPITNRISPAAMLLQQAAWYKFQIEMIAMDNFYVLGTYRYHFWYRYLESNIGLIKSGIYHCKESNIGLIKSGIYHCKVRIHISADIQKVKYQSVSRIGCASVWLLGKILAWNRRSRIHFLCSLHLGASSWWRDRHIGTTFRESLPSDRLVPRVDNCFSHSSKEFLFLENCVEMDHTIITCFGIDSI